MGGRGRHREPLTTAQLEVLRAIWEMTMEHGWAPSFKELGERLNVSSTNGVLDKVSRLHRDGLVKRANMQSRCLCLTRDGHEAIGSPPGNPFVRD